MNTLQHASRVNIRLKKRVAEKGLMIYRGRVHGRGKTSIRNISRLVVQGRLTCSGINGKSTIKETKLMGYFKDVQKQVTEWHRDIMTEILLKLACRGG